MIFGWVAAAVDGADGTVGSEGTGAVTTVGAGDVGCAMLGDGLTVFWARDEPVANASVKARLKSVRCTEVTMLRPDLTHNVPRSLAATLYAVPTRVTCTRPAANA